MKKSFIEAFTFRSKDEVPAAFKDPRFKGGTTTLAAIITLMLERGLKGMAINLWVSSYNQWLEMRKIPSGIGRARHNYQTLDDGLKRHFDADPNRIKEISCSKGCSGCCYQEVFITDDEAMLLAKKVKDGMVIDVDRLKKQAKIKDADGWMPVPKETRKCVFLGDDSLCRIYEDRPLACRKYFVTTPPEICHDITADNKTYVVHAVEAMVSAALNLKPQSGPLAKLLLSKL